MSRYTAGLLNWALLFSLVRGALWTAKQEQSWVCCCKNAALIVPGSRPWWWLNV